ncbi:hypothetical protein HDU83_000468 [Entophlyctis luteolus]|nr:hypothetical protein HDU83_000468 [Entophlyctis luteolus]
MTFLASIAQTLQGLRFIDAETERVVEIADATAARAIAVRGHIAVTHAWGRRGGTTLHTDDLVAWTVPANAHWAGKRAAVLGAARALHARYVWFDVLCVDPHDAEDKALAVSRMHVVFRLARCVLLLANCDCAVGMPCAVTAAPVYEDRMEASKALVLEWRERVWTYQEGLLAQQLIVVCGDNMLVPVTGNGRVVIRLSLRFAVDKDGTDAASSSSSSSSIRSNNNTATSNSVNSILSDVHPLTSAQRSMLLTAFSSFGQERLALWTHDSLACHLAATSARACTHRKDRLFGIAALLAFTHDHIDYHQEYEDVARAFCLAAYAAGEVGWLTVRRSASLAMVGTGRFPDAETINPHADYRVYSTKFGSDIRKDPNRTAGLWMALKDVPKDWLSLFCLDGHKEEEVALLFTPLCFNGDGDALVVGLHQAAKDKWKVVATGKLANSAFFLPRMIAAELDIW